MNKRQRIVLRIGAAVVLAFLLFPNFISGIGNGSPLGLGISFIFAPPTNPNWDSFVGYVDSLSIIAETFSVAFICAALWWSEKD